MKDHNLMETVNAAMERDYAFYKQAGWLERDITLDEYMVMNTFTYSSAIGSYIGILQDIAEYSKSRYDTDILNEVKPHLAQGLYLYNKICAELWNRFLHGKSTNGGDSISLMAFKVTEDGRRLKEAYENLHYLLRYLKRFCPVGVKADEKGTLDRFLECSADMLRLNNEVEKDHIHLHILDAIRTKWSKLDEGMADIINHNRQRLLNPFKKDSDHFPMHLPNGATSEGHSTPFEKYKSAASYLPNYYIDDMIIQNEMGDYALVSDFDGLAYTISDEGYQLIEGVFSQMSIVAKSYDKSRTICEEHAYVTVGTGCLLDGVKEFIYKHIPSLDSLEDKLIANQFLLEHFSDYGTIDQTSASDRVARCIMSTCFPETYEALKGFRSTHAICGNKIIELPQFATMGSRLTMIFQSLIYYVIADYCADIVGLFNPRSVSKFMHRPSRICGPRLETKVVGDDIMVPAIIAETFIDITTSLGFKVNWEKTYFKEKDLTFKNLHLFYRESCGAEIILCVKSDGHVIGGMFSALQDNELVYYSRKPLYEDWAAIEGLIEHQHNLMKRNLKAGAQLLTKMLRHAEIKAFFNDSVKEVQVDVDSVLFADKIGGDPLAIWSDSPIYPIVPSPKRDDDAMFPTRVFPTTVQRLVVTPVMVVGKHSSADLKNLSQLAYYNFLQSGPNYKDKLSEVLGITSPACFKQQFAGRQVGIRLEIITE